MELNRINFMPLGCGSLVLVASQISLIPGKDFNISKAMYFGSSPRPLPLKFRKTTLFCNGKRRKKNRKTGSKKVLKRLGMFIPIKDVFKNQGLAI